MWVGLEMWEKIFKDSGEEQKRSGELEQKDKDFRLQTLQAAALQKGRNVFIFVLSKLKLKLFHIIEILVLLI